MSLAMCPRCGKNTTEIHSCSPNSVITSLRDEVVALTKERDAWREESNIGIASMDMLKGQLDHQYDQLDAAQDEIAALTEKIVTFQADNTRITLELDEAGSNCSMYKQQVLNAQADNARMRVALEQIASCAVSFQFFTISDKVYGNDKVEAGPVMRAFRLHKQIADEALSTPLDDSSLQERLKQERERVAQMILNGSFLHTEAPVAIWAREVSAAIRSMI